uniref:C2H2-type domain-containing protein n=1 Tax=Culex tarsalis TaxID=7177 RepID=A0A1Q3EV44_CULTA
MSSSANKNDNADLARHYILALHQTPMCRFCFREGPEAKLSRISESPLRDAVHEMFPPSLYGLTEEELPDWFCGVCRMSLNSSKKLQKRAVCSQLKMLPMSVEAVVERTSRKRSRVVDMATVVPSPVGRKIERKRLNFSSCVLTPVRKDSTEDLAELVDDKRVPDILTKTLSQEEQLSTCSVARTISDEDFPITLLDPSNPCSHCRLLFATGQQVGWHTRVHTGRGTLRCRFCPQKLAKVSVYIRHVTRQHAAIRRTQCSLCDESFGAGSCRVVHEQNHERTRMKYACSFCPLIFNRYKKLRQHRQQMHNDWKLMCRSTGSVTTDE